MRKLSIPERPDADGVRWARNAVLARYLGVSEMCIWNWQRDPDLDFPQPARINGIDYTDLGLVDGWMRLRVVVRNRGEQQRKRRTAKADAAFVEPEAAA